ncbi:hypothetical protein ACF0H5_005264 [Mactra antiquata]
MAVNSLKIGSLPDSIRAKYDKLPLDLNAVQMAREVPRQYQRNAEDVQLLKFPSTKNILWDHSVTGEPQTLHISYFRKPRLCVAEKVLRFAQRHVESNGQKSCNCVLVGTLNVDEDGEGVIFNVERLDPAGNPNNSTSHAAGDVLIPFHIQSGSKDRGSTADDYCNALQLLKQRCCSKDPVELGNFLLTKGWCSFYTTGETCVHHLEFEVVTMGTEIKAVPIEPVPIVPTALSKNLSGPMSISHMQGTPKTGYLTMDHTRKLLLVLESDPKVISLPLVGIWISGISYVHSPYVWACCLRYLHNASIQDRVCSPPDPFLLVLYNPTHSKPEFYECSTTSGSNKMSFDYYTGYEAVQINKNSMGNNETVEVDMTLLREGNKYELFQEAVLSSSNDSGLETSRRSLSPDPVSHDDITPRLKPAPHKSKLPIMQSMVPEVSLFFGDEDTTFVPNVQKPKVDTNMPRTDMGHLQTSVPAQPISSKGHISNHPVPNSSNSGVQGRPATTLVNSYVNNTQGMKPPQSSSQNVYRGSNVQPYPSSYPAPVSQEPVSHQSYPSMPQNIHHNGPRPSYIHSQMGPGPRPPYCSCPSCPRPPPMYGRSQSYDNVRPPAHQPRPTYNYGQPPRVNGPYPGYPPQSYHHQSVPYNQPYPPYPQDHCVPTSVPFQNPPVSSNPGRPSNNIQQSRQVQESSNRVQMSEASSNPNTMHPSSSKPGPKSNGHLPMPQASGGLPMRAEERNSGPKTPGQSAEGVVTNSNEIRRSNPASDSSGRSSDDSGLSFTPEKHHSPQNPSPKSEPPTTSDMKPSLAAVNWQNVPPEIYQLLMQQDKQLKQMQAQIEVLTAQSLNNTAESAQIKAMSPSEKCTIGINTSFDFGEPKSQVSACMQTSQQDDGYYNTNQPQMSQKPSRPRPQINQDMSHSSSNGSGCDTRTPAEIRHRGRLPMNSTQKDDADLDMSQGELVALMNNMHDKTIDSVQSEMIVDLPSFQSSPTRSPRSQESCNDSAAFNMSPRSPISASMCEQQIDNDNDDDRSESDYSDDEGEDNTAGTDNPEYYNRLMDNIKKLLSQNTTENTLEGDLGYSGDVSSDPSTPVKLAHEDIKLGEHLQSFFRFDGNTPVKGPADTTFIPKINYVSMLLDSDTDTSMEINAMAMKYLKDEQLTQLTKLQAKNRLLQGSKKTSEKSALLQKILKMEDDSTPNVTNVGMSPNDLTFATKKYLEKHGLLGDKTICDTGSTSASDNTQNDSYRLRTNYSTMTSGSDDGPAQITHEVLSTPSNRQDMSTPSGLRLGTYSNGTTPTNDHSRPTFNDSNPSIGFNGTPKPNHVQSRLEDHRRLTPNSYNSNDNSVPMAHKPSPHVQHSSPYTQDSSVKGIGATGRYVNPCITRAPNPQNHSPPEREVQRNHYSRDTGKNEYDYSTRNIQYGRQLPVQPKQSAASDVKGVPNYYDSRLRDNTVDDDRILDITRLKQLPKLL